MLSRFNFILFGLCTPANHRLRPMANGPFPRMSTTSNRLFICIFLSLQFNHIATAQSLYAFQQDDTLLKREYYEQSQQKKIRLLSFVKKQYASDYKKIYEDQFKEIGKLWQSSRSVTAPGAHDYLQAVVSRLVDANPELKGTDARVVFSRDWWPNACSMGDGTIAINAGLMIFFRNEAELAFVVSHELAHYYLGHTERSIQKYVETINSGAYQEELKRLSRTTYRTNQQLDALSQSVTFGSRRHSRDNEVAADRLAFTFLRRTGYDCGAARSCLELLDKVDDSLLYRPLDLGQVFNFREYPFRKRWVQEESSIFSQLDEKEGSHESREKDSLKTHPDCARRIVLLKDSIDAIISPGRAYLVDENAFGKLKNDFIIEIMDQCYREDKLGRNLYYALLLLQDPDRRRIAVYSVARCLNRLYDKQRDHQFGLAVDKEGPGFPKEYNLLLRMLDRLRLAEIADLNYNFCLQYQSLMNGYAGFNAEIKKTQLNKH